jgi:hypothetical protein
MRETGPAGKSGLLKNGRAARAPLWFHPLPSRDGAAGARKLI